ncbi:bifunctional folylpolyglutamate synthase/dihydrofolate synthase [Thermodesulfobacteriota bacterium]
MKKRIASYQEGITYLYKLQKFGIKFGLSKTSNLLAALGNPHKGPKYIHIAGTNGKGSVAAFLASVLKESGLKVGLYTSPHLVRFTERFRINGSEIPREKAAALIDELRHVFVKEELPTFFEATTAMALLYFAREKTDISIMEVGMGGRLDATNIIKPIVCAITNISMEHQFFLGSRLLDIAKEKAGIIKNGVDVITAATQPEVIKLFESIAKEKSAPLWRIGKDARYRTTQSGFDYFGQKLRLNGLEMGLKGKFQVRNAAHAIFILERLKHLGFQISAQYIREGIRKARWAGRMQIISRNPSILLDGSHNPSAVRALAKSIKTSLSYKRLILVIGIMEDKEIGPILRGIVPEADYVFYTRPLYPRAASPNALMAKSQGLNRPGESVKLLTAALDKAKEMAEPEDLIVVCGSLFTVGEALSYLEPEDYKPDEFS